MAGDKPNQRTEAAIEDEIRRILSESKSLQDALPRLVETFCEQSERLRESEERYRAVADSAAYGILTMDE